MQTVSWIIRPVAVATGIAAPTAGSRYRTGTEIFQLRNLLEHRRSLLFHFCKGFGHGSSFYRAYHIRSVFEPTKENSHITHLYVAHPPEAGGIVRRILMIDLGHVAIGNAASSEFHGMSDGAATFHCGWSVDASRRLSRMDLPELWAWDDLSAHVRP